MYHSPSFDLLRPSKDQIINDVSYKKHFRLEKRDTEQTWCSGCKAGRETLYQRRRSPSGCRLSSWPGLFDVRRSKSKAFYFVTLYRCICMKQIRSASMYYKRRMHTRTAILFLFITREHLQCQQSPYMRHTPVPAPSYEAHTPLIMMPVSLMAVTNLPYSLYLRRRNSVPSQTGTDKFPDATPFFSMLRADCYRLPDYTVRLFIFLSSHAPG